MSVDLGSSRGLWQVHSVMGGNFVLDLTGQIMEEKVPACITAPVACQSFTLNSHCHGRQARLSLEVEVPGLWRTIYRPWLIKPWCMAARHVWIGQALHPRRVAGNYRGGFCDADDGEYEAGLTEGQLQGGRGC